MLYLNGALGLALFALWVYCIIEVITSESWECRNLPKMVWLLIVVFLPEVGSIAWLIAGRPLKTIAAPEGMPDKGNTGKDRTSGFPEYERPGRQTATNPDDDEAFLRGLRERAEEQRRAAKRPQDPPQDTA